jgi:hypothetical protein
MHPYATNSTERKVVILSISVLSILLAYSLNAARAALHWSVPWWLDVPSVLGFFSLLYACFDQYLWRWTLFRRVGLVKVPDLNGTWKGELHSGHQAFGTPHAIRATITQTWTAVCIELHAMHSMSESTMAALVLPKPGTVLLMYQYCNRPTADATGTMHTHDGTARMNFSLKNGKAVLEGEYYSGRDRNNIGKMKLERDRKQ